MPFQADFRQLQGLYQHYIMAQCIETQLMLNESSGKDLQIMVWSLFCHFPDSLECRGHLVMFERAALQVSLS